MAWISSCRRNGAPLVYNGSWPMDLELESADMDSGKLAKIEEAYARGE